MDDAILLDADISCEFMSVYFLKIKIFKINLGNEGKIMRKLQLLSTCMIFLEDIFLPLE